MVDLERERAVRAATFEFLGTLRTAFPDAIPAQRLLEGFELEGRRISLMSHGLGIWKPKGLDAALSVLTTAPKANEPPPYRDVLTADGRLQYAYQGHDPSLWTNRALRLAWEHRLPLLYRCGVGRIPGLGTGYFAEFPAYVEADHPGALRVDLVFDSTAEVQGGVGVELEGASGDLAGTGPERACNDFTRRHFDVGC